MTRLGGIPADYDRIDTGSRTVIVASGHAPALARAGLDRTQGWSRRLEPTAVGAGRGGTARLELDDGTQLVLKQMRRGGLLAPIWRERFVGRERLLDNVRVPVEALRRGVATARPIVLLLEGGPPGLYRGWLATEAIAAAEDLTRIIAGADPPTRIQIGAVVREIRRMHDAGVDHPDLNLGNLLLRRLPPDEPRAFIVDLDRARLCTPPLSWPVRIRALRRLERSSVKLFGERPLAEFDLCREWYVAYAAGDARTERRLERARRGNRLRFGLHRLGWR